jgi:alpha-1,6-mannosyltransferase
VSRGRQIALAASGAALLALAGLALLFQLQNDFDRFLTVALMQGAVYLVAVWSVWSGVSSRRIVFGIAAIAALMRIPVVCAPPYLSTDIYRYVWDGRVTAAGINPYRYVPADPQLEKLRDPDIFPKINRAGTAVTIYPPVAEAIFLMVTRVSESVTAIKAAMVGFEIITFALLVRLLVAEGLPTGRVVVYAWHPLPLWEFAGSGHIDAALIALAVAALWAMRRGRSGLAGLFLAGATLTKLYPAVLLPALYRRWGWTMPTAFAAAIVVGYLPFIGVGWQIFGFLPGYAGEEGFDVSGTGFYLLGLLRQLPPLAGLNGRAYAVAAVAILAALGAAIVFARARDAARAPFAAATVLATTLVVLVSPHYPWYFAWLIVFACFLRSLALLWLTTMCLLLYLVPVESHIVRDAHRLAVESMIYGPFAALAVMDLWYHRRYQHHGATRSS